MPDDGAPPGLDLSRVLTKLEQLDPKLVQLAMLQVLAEDQQREIAELRKQLVDSHTAEAPEVEAE